MGSDWVTYRIEDIAKDEPHSMSTGPFGSAISSRYFEDSGVPVIRGGNLSTEISQRMSDENLVFISEKKGKEFERSIVRPGDLIFTCWGTINQVGLITEDLLYSEYIISNKQMKLTPDPKKADPYFLYYFFSSPMKQAEILSNSIGAAVPGFNLGQLKRHLVSLPNIDEQKKIVSILKLLDCRINHNLQINKTLEMISQSFFKSWFIDFEPVKAKDHIRKLGGKPEQIERAAQAVIAGAVNLEDILNSLNLNDIDAMAKSRFEAKKGPEWPNTKTQCIEASSLFSDRLVELKLGLIPEGWQCSNVKEIVKRLKAPKRYTKKQVQNHGIVPVYEQGTSLLLGLHDDEPGFEAEPENPVFIFGDHTCITHLSLSPFDISQNVIPIQGNNRSTIWTYYAVKDLQQFQEYRRHWSEFVIKNVVVPPKELCDLFGDIVTINHLKTEQNNTQNRVLERTRDTLLPKLLSGEIQLNV